MAAVAVWIGILAACLGGGLGPDFPAAAARLLRREALAGARVGIEVRAMADGSVLYEHRACEAFVPASNQKLLTLALALERLGEDFFFETPLVATVPLDAQGRLHGDLWVRGSGDPTLSARFCERPDPHAALEPFVRALELQKVRRIDGDLVVDDRVFDAEVLAAGWPADQFHKDYCAPVAGLSLNGNCLEVEVTGREGGAPLVTLLPRALDYSLRPDLERSTDAREMLVALQRPDEQGRVSVRGRVGAAAGTGRFLVPVRDPALYFGRALAHALQESGIALGGRVRRPHPQEAPPAGARTLYTRKSPLLPAVFVCGKESDNAIAEHLYKAAAVQAGQPGSFAGGAAACREFLAELGCTLEGFACADGSGLSRENRLSPRLLVELLTERYASPHRDALVRSLPIAGVDGTLRKRMEEDALRYRVRAKTGYLRGVSCLSGYLMAGAAEDPVVLAFSILVNDFGNVSLRDVQAVQDDFCRLLLGAVG